MKQTLLALSILSVLLFADISAFSQQAIILPPHASVYSGSARGYWFVAPTDFTITGLRVAPQAGAGLQYIQVVEVLDPMPIAFTAQSSNFNLLNYTSGYANGQIVPVSISISTGQTIGILGTAGTGNSYGNGPSNVSILGFPTQIQRFGYQGNINITQAPVVWGVGPGLGGQISRVELYYTPSVVSNYPYCQDFESGSQGWNEGGTNNSWELGAPGNTIINSAASGTEAWVTNLTGDHNSDEVSAVLGPEFDFSDLVDPAISLEIFWDAETSFDGANLQTSIDGGASWQTVGAFGNPNNWYNNNNVEGLLWTNDLQGWSGDGGTGSGGWVTAENDFTGLAGADSVLLRVAFGSNSAVENEGFAFDNICVGETDDVGISEIIVADSVCGDDSTAFSVVVCNFGIHTQNNFTVAWNINGSPGSMPYTNTLTVGQCDTIVVSYENTEAGGLYDFEAWTNLTGDVKITNDTAEQDSILFYEIPVGSIHGGGTICADGTTIVTIDLTGGGPWTFGYTDSTNQTFINNVGTSPYNLTTNQPGLYTLVAMIDSNGCAANILTGSATVVVNPLPVISLGSDTTICGSETLDPGAGFSSYVWHDGSTNQTFLATTNNSYSVTVTDANGCTDSDTINLNANPLPVVNLGADIELCEGESSTIDAGAGFIGYLWSDTSNGQILSVNMLGTYSVTVTDFNGCQGNDAIEVTGINPLPTPDLGPDLSVSPSTIVTLDPGVFSSYIWQDGTTTTQTFNPTFSGTYWVEVTDDNDCMKRDSMVLDLWPNGITALGNQGVIKYYPNPTDGLLNIELLEMAGANLDIHVTNISGQILKKRVLTKLSNNSTITLDLSDLAKGIYFLQFSNNEKSVTQRIIVH